MGEGVRVLSLAMNSLEENSLVVDFSLVISISTPGIYNKVSLEDIKAIVIGKSFGKIGFSLSVLRSQKEESRFAEGLWGETLIFRWLKRRKFIDFS